MSGTESTASHDGTRFVPTITPKAYAAFAAIAFTAAGSLALTVGDAQSLAAPAFAGTFLLIAIGLATTGRYVAAGATTVSGGTFVLSLAADLGGSHNLIAAVIVTSALVAVWGLERRTTGTSD